MYISKRSNGTLLTRCHNPPCVSKHVDLCVQVSETGTSNLVLMVLMIGEVTSVCIMDILISFYVHAWRVRPSSLWRVMLLDGRG